MEEDDDALTRMSGDVPERSPSVKSKFVKRRFEEVFDRPMESIPEDIFPQAPGGGDSEDEALLPNRPPGGFPETGPQRPPQAAREYPQTAREAEERGASMITPILIGLVFLVLANYTTM